MWSEVGAGTEVELRTSCQRRLCDIRAALLVVTALGDLQHCRRDVRGDASLTGGSPPIRILAVDDHPAGARRDRRSRGSSAGYDRESHKPPTAAKRSSNSAPTVRT